MMAPKYNVHINNLNFPDDSNRKDDKTKKKPEQKTVVRQVVHQHGENSFNFTEPVSHFHIGDTIISGSESDDWD